jgi:hypothetical protein
MFYSNGMRGLTIVLLVVVGFLAGAGLFLATRPRPVLHALVLELQGAGLFERCRQAGACARLDIKPPPQTRPRELPPADLDRA